MKCFMLTSSLDKGKKKGQSDLLVADADATPELREAVEVRGVCA